MSKKYNQYNEVAKSYGIVLFNLAQQNKELKPVLKDVTQLYEGLASASFEWKQITNPTIPLATQQQTIDKIAKTLKLCELMRCFLQAVCQHYRLHILPFILESFINRYQKEAGLVEGVVETAAELSQQEIMTLQQTLGQRLGKKVTLQQEIKENLLGGVVLHVDSLIIDASLRTQLDKLHQVMKG